MKQTIYISPLSQIKLGLDNIPNCEVSRVIKNVKRHVDGLDNVNYRTTINVQGKILVVECDTENGQFELDVYNSLRLIEQGR